MRLNCPEDSFPAARAAGAEPESGNDDQTFQYRGGVGSLSGGSPRSAGSGSGLCDRGSRFRYRLQRGLEPRGLEFLRETVNAVSIPVFAIGGISAENVEAVRKAGAAGACIMSQMMRGEFYEK